jgi:hypothetical protein
MAFGIQRVFGSKDLFTDAAHPLRRRIRQISADEWREEVCAGIDPFHRECGLSDTARRRRWGQVRCELARAGFDRHTPDDRDDPLWRDVALTELQRAVLHSYTQAGVTLLDHLTASPQFTKFHLREQVMGRRVAAAWRRIVPPRASAITDVFHLQIRNFHPVPNYSPPVATTGTACCRSTATCTARDSLRTSTGGPALEIVEAHAVVKGPRLPGKAGGQTWPLLNGSMIFRRGPAITWPRRRTISRVW